MTNKDLPLPPEKMAVWEKLLWGVPLTRADQELIDIGNADGAIMDACKAFESRLTWDPQQN